MVVGSDMSSHFSEAERLLVIARVYRTPLALLWYNIRRDQRLIHAEQSILDPGNDKEYIRDVMKYGRWCDSCRSLDL